MNQPTAQQKNKPAPICHAERCRLKLAVLPSYTHVSAKIKKYMQMYIDLQSYRHYPPVISRELLKHGSRRPSQALPGDLLLELVCRSRHLP